MTVREGPGCLPRHSQCQCLPPVWGLQAGGGGAVGPLRTQIFDIFHMRLTAPHSHPTLTFWSDRLIIHLMLLTCHDAVMRPRQTQGGRLYRGEGGREGGRDLINICSSSTCCDHSKDLIEKQTWSLHGVHIWMIDCAAAKTARINELCRLGRKRQARSLTEPSLWMCVRSVT